MRDRHRPKDLLISSRGSPYVFGRFVRKTRATRLQGAYDAPRKIDEWFTEGFDTRRHRRSEGDAGRIEPLSAMMPFVRLGQGRPREGEIPWHCMSHLVKDGRREGGGQDSGPGCGIRQSQENTNESLGAKILCTVACFGEYDFVSVTEYPNEVCPRLKGGRLMAASNR